MYKTILQAKICLKQAKKTALRLDGVQALLGFAIERLRKRAKKTPFR